MAKLTENIIMPPGANYHPPVQPDEFNDVGTIPDITTTQRTRAASAVIRRFGTWTDDDGEPHATDESAELLLTLFCTQPKRRRGTRAQADAAKRGTQPPQLAAARDRAMAHAEAQRFNEAQQRRRIIDPADSQHPPEDIGAWRAQVCTWGRANGWPNAHSKQALDPDMLAAYRAAQKRQDRLAAWRELPYVGPSASARALRAKIRAWGYRNGWPINSHGSLNPRLVEAYYAAHPEES